MSQVATIPFNSPAAEARKLALIQRTIAPDCTPDEFNLFIHSARHLGLDPLRRQIFPLVFNKDDASKRRMSLITSIDGLRSIAARTGDYRPDDQEASFEIARALVDSTNLAGLVKATVRVWKYARGEWHPVPGTAYWSEYAPIKNLAEEYRWEETGEVWEDTGRPKKRKVAVGEVKRTLDPTGKWPQMPRLMLAKCAEAQALRKAWPDDLAAVYAHEEIDRARAEMLPSEIAAAGGAEERLERVGGGQTILVQWADHEPIVAVPVGQFADKAMDFIRQNREEPAAIERWRQHNRHALREFWARSPTDALEVKKALEAATRALSAPDEPA